MVENLLGCYTIEVSQGMIRLPELWKPKQKERLLWVIIEEIHGDRSIWKMRIGPNTAALLDSTNDSGVDVLQSGETSILSNDRWPLPIPFARYLGGEHSVVLKGMFQCFELWKDTDDQWSNAELLASLKDVIKILHDI